MKHTILWVCAGAMVFVAALPSHAAKTGHIRPKMRAVVKCVYDIVRSNPNLISTEVFSVGTYKYVIEYKFEQNGTVFTGGMGIHDGGDDRGDYFYSNDTPAGQADDHGFVELKYLSNEIGEAMEKCHLMPGFDNTMMLPGLPPPPRQKIEMPR